MASKNVRFAETPLMDEEDIQYLRRKRRKVDEAVETVNEESGEQTSREKKQQHTLDSDEEEETKYDRLDINKVYGQEDATIEYDGNVKITAFNMKEDMEEGHFDNEGNFIFDKKQEEIKDAWLDGIDWNRVKQNAGTHWEKEGEDADTDALITKFDEKPVYLKLLSILHDKETIANALKRMNSEKGLSAAEERKRRWAAKKAGHKYEDNSAAVAELTSLADSLVSAGHMGAYQLDKDSITKILDEIAGKEKISFDMFSDEPTTSDGAVNKEIEIVENRTMWEYQLENEKNVLGPFSTSDMIKKLEDGDLGKPGTMVRRIGTSAFYDLKRIDFDLFD